MTQEERADRRARIVREVKNGTTLHEVALMFGMSYFYIRSMCSDAGLGLSRACTRQLAPSPRPIRGTRSFDILADLLNTDLSMIEIAAKHGCTKQWVSHLNSEAKKAGICVPHRLQGRNAVGVQTAEVILRAIRDTDEAIR